ncbi:MAG: DNA-3-methyladenine glycosylase [Candidatus Thorarchaeota archaeon]
MIIIGKQFEIIPQNFYFRDTKKVAIDLLGKYIVHKTSKDLLIGKIVETEAYLGELDPACHAYQLKPSTKSRGAIFFEPPGTIYVYITYGIHHCFNVIAKPSNKLGGVLVRAIEPIYGKNTMIKNRGGVNNQNITNGPGKLCQAMQISLSNNNNPVYNGNLTIRKNIDVSSDNSPNYKKEIFVSTRIGISKAKDWMLRYFLANNKYVSGSKNQNAMLVNLDDYLLKKIESS